jgi:predicted AAA+ superfamily ATPase
MDYLKRIYDSVLTAHLRENRQMVFLSGPRQVGKTTESRQVGDFYPDWDNRKHQNIILNL